MKKLLLVIAMLFATAVSAKDIMNKNEKWDMTTGPKTITVTKVAVDNIQATCEAESRKRGNGGFGFGVEACTFWKGNQCTIFVQKRETHHTLGHEFYHCFSGAYH